jgi:serine/threonine protein kinase
MKLAGPDGLDSLELTDFLGNGAFGLVFKAKSTVSSEIYAVKFPQVSAFADRGELLAFENEVKASQEITHPNVTKVVHVEMTPQSGLPYLVMEYVAGGTLLNKIKTSRDQSQNIPIDVLRKWVEGILEGISAINTKLLHRDIKPDNILMSGETPRIADFGLSKIVGAATRTSTFKGTQHCLYKAPESWKNEKNTIQMDMYSVGLVFYELATLKYPYNLPSDLSNIEGFRRMHLFEQAPSIEKLRNDLPLSFCHWVQRLIAKRPTDRFPDWKTAIEKFRECWKSNDDSANPSKAVLTQTLLEQFGKAHDANTKSELEKARIENDRKELELRNKYQRNAMFQIIESLLQDFNDRSSLGAISIHSTEIEEIISIPHGRPLSLRYFEVDPPLNLKKGTVRFAGLLSVKPATSSDFHVSHYEDGLVNFLLLEESQDDYYGTWIACEVFKNALARSFPPGTPRRETFGLSKRLVREIEKSDRSMHIFHVNYSSDIQNAITKAIGICLS